MADRYFRQITATGGEYALNTTANWSTTSGGSGGASVPTSSDNAFFDANTGSGVTGTSGGGLALTCLNFDATGYPGTFKLGTTAAVFGDFTLGGANCPKTVTMSATSGTKSISTTGAAIPSLIINGAGGTFQLSDSLTVTGSITFTNGTFTNSSMDVTADSFALGSGTKAIQMVAGIWTVGSTGTGTKWDFNTNKAGLTLTTVASTIVVNNGASAMTFATGGLDYSNANQSFATTIYFKGTGVITVQNTGATFNVIKYEPNCQVRYTAGITLNTHHLEGGGTAGNLATVTTTSAGSAANINVTSTNEAINVTPFMSYKDITASGSTIYAPSSTNVSGNTNIVFDYPPNGAMVMFFG